VADGYFTLTVHSLQVGKTLASWVYSSCRARARCIQLRR